MWQRDALMRGAEVAVLGAAPPGGAAGRGRGAGPAAEACPTCPGARGGPGGARAFPGGANDAPQGGNQPQGPAVKLTREPALARLAARDTGNLGQRATKVLARVEWTGKPGRRRAVAPLSAIEQQRFTAGRDLYLGRCQSCHNENGRGQPNLGSALVGSADVGGPSARVTRIVLQGKEGADRPDAAGRSENDGRTGGRSADVHTPRLGQHGAANRCRRRRTRADGDVGPESSMDRRGALGHRPGRAVTRTRRTSSRA